MIGQSLRWRVGMVLVSVAWLGLAATVRAQADKPAEGRAGPGYRLVPKSARRIKAALTVEMKAPNLLADEWSVFVSPIPELPGQVETRTTLVPQGKLIRELSDATRPMILTRIPSLGEQWRRGVKARADYEATLLERRLEPLEPGDPPPTAVASLDARSRRFWLASGHQFDFNTPRFKAWLTENQLRREPAENEVDFARKAFLAVRHGFTHYEGADVPHLASKVCELGKSDFAGLTAVFVAALRANGIPTRVLAGRMVLMNGKPTKATWPHARTEFYVTGLGWVPADPAGAIRSGRKTEGLEFFGNDNAEFLTHHLDTDIILDTYFGTKTHEWLMDPALWMIGGGNFDGNSIKVDVTVTVEELNLTDVIERLNTQSGPTNPGASPKNTSKKSAAKTSKKGR